MAAQKWMKTKYPGVRYREHQSRLHGRQKDRYYTITYKLNGKTKTEAVGWASEGVKPADVSDLLNQLKRNHREKTGFQTLAEKRELAEVAERKEKEAYCLAEQDKMTLVNVWEQHYFTQAQHNKAEKSWKREESLFRIWITPLLGHKVFSEIGVQDLETLKSAMIAKGASLRSVEYALAVIRQMFNVMISYDLYHGDNPVSRVKKPKEDNRRTRFLNEKEAKELLDRAKARNIVLYRMMLLSLYTGLRAGEILKLTWEDVDFANEMLSIRDTKSGKNRHVYMTKLLFSELKLQQDVKSDYSEERLVFIGRFGGPMNEVSRLFKELVDDLRLNENVEDSRQRVVFHTLRHTFASWLVQRGTPLYTVASLMGHSTIAMTERYAHLAPDGLREAVKVLEE
ncbi:tyrosine-type recombinase/integrase [Halodesulfovibrio marinisediminis]|uniref:Site-specific recombinase XerD n=1 Tax=Halodesulfovibrio marinisediminis DSM 17456 TaxID=1121457 RepID=A0A1N6IG33_9BACT|nr:site-specific integrase [Halodesulfovibrio marinisediminis]SIO30915.1 Site-specific recombinase XerD [Halodesulfovibrio marinisediminis DSM 17456]